MTQSDIYNEIKDIIVDNGIIDKEGNALNYHVAIFNNINTVLLDTRLNKKEVRSWVMTDEFDYIKFKEYFKYQFESNLDYHITAEDKSSVLVSLYMPKDL